MGGEYRMVILRRGGGRGGMWLWQSKKAHPCNVIHVNLSDGLTKQLDVTLSKREHAAGIVRRSFCLESSCRADCREILMHGTRSNSNSANRHPRRYIEADIESQDENRQRTENKVQLNTSHDDLDDSLSAPIDRAICAQ